MEMDLPRLAYSFASAFVKVGLFVLTIFTAFHANAAAVDTISVWLTVPFCVLAIYGSACAGEAIDRSIRRWMGWEVEPS